jgi:phage-related holin
VPNEIKSYIGNLEIGIASLFAIIFVLYEFTSVLKNMVLCGLPVPKKLKDKVESLLNNFTSELDKK